MARNALVKVVEPSELSSQQQAVIELLIGGRMKADAAREVGIVPTSISNWMRQPLFLAALNERRLDVFSANAERLRTLASKALEVVESALESPELSDRLRAASIILKAVKLDDLPTPDDAISLADVKRRLAAVENDNALADMITTAFGR